MIFEKKQSSAKLIRTLLRWLTLAMLLASAQALAQTGGTVTYVYTDPQGTPLAETDASGNITATFEYTPYGTYAPQGTSTPGPTPNGPGYTGHVNDPETNLVYMQARYYDPVTGHFLSPDPVAPSAANLSGFNRYDYAENNPIVNDDPTGRDSCSAAYNCQTIWFGGHDDGGGNNQTHPGMFHSVSQALIGFVKGVESETKDWPIVGDDAGAPGVTASNSTQAKGMAVGAAAVTIGVAVASDGEDSNLVDLAPERRAHILSGDNQGGGHRFGAGSPGKTEFPQGWSDSKIMHEISDVATDPNSVRSAGRWGGTVVEGTRDGINIRVYVGQNGNIISGFPTNTPRNP